MSDIDTAIVQLIIPRDIANALEFAARNNGREMAEEILLRIRASLLPAMSTSTVTEEDVLAVTSKVALMAGHRRQARRADRKRQSGSETKK